MSEKKEIECAMREWRTEDGTPVLGHVFVDIEEHDNCHVTVSKCENCGRIDIGWYPMDQPPVRGRIPPEPGDYGTVNRSKP